jgi:Suppressor of fused protein (SUFU)
VTQVLDEVRAHLRGHFMRAGIDADPDIASVTFLGVEHMDVLRFGPEPDGSVHYVTVGCARHPMTDPSEAVADPLRGPRAEVVLTLHSGSVTPGLARSLAIIAATPAVEGMVLVADALIDLSGPLWTGAPFTAVLLGPAEVADLPLPDPLEPVRFLAAVPITGNEAAWVRLKGADAMRQAWLDDGVDILDPGRPAVRPK